jgi:serine/threonine protein phosphatase PrpC
VGLIDKILRQVFQPLTWCISTSSSAGTFRNENEDFVCLGYRENAACSVLADGVGGQSAGEVASRFVCENLKQWFEARYTADGLNSAQLQVQAAITSAHEALWRMAKSRPELADMSTTLALALQFERKAIIAWAGDSRIYHFRRGTLLQISEDHSFVEEKVQQGVLSRAEANHHHMANVITSCLGGWPRIPRLGLKVLDLNINDYLLLVSDGVSSVLGPEQMSSLLPLGAEAVVNAAIAADSRDNCSAIVVHVQLDSPVESKV